MYQYVAVVVRVVDGDSVIMDVDLGFGVWLRGQSIRLLGCNAWERYTDPGRAATANLIGLLPAGLRVVITSVKVDKYGSRYDAEVILPDGRNLVTVLCADGWAAPWDGKGAAPLPAWPREEAAA